MVRAIPAADLRAYYVWVPAIASDNLAAARRAAERFADPRVRHFFDGGAHFGERLGKMLRLPGRVGHPEETGLGWDVFLVYDRQADWRDDPPEPTYWMHQLMAVAIDGAEVFDPAKLRARVEALLGQGPRHD